MSQTCDGILHPKAREGIELFNQGKFFEAHEELELAWRDEPGEIRNLYQGILQAAVAYLHITRGNYDGAVKVHGRSMRHLKDWQNVCRGVHVEKLRQDMNAVMEELQRLGRDHIQDFDASLLRPVVWSSRRAWTCDRCGSAMYEKNCKVTCPNCGNRFDCSDLNLYFD